MTQTRLVSLGADGRTARTLPPGHGGKRGWGWARVAVVRVGTVVRFDLAV